MTIAAKRQRIVDLLNTVTDVHGYLREPNAASVGDSWADWTELERDSGVTYNTWTVYVVLPSGDADASAWQDDHLELIIDGLEASYEFIVTGARSFADPVYDTTTNKLQLTLRSE